MSTSKIQFHPAPHGLLRETIQGVVRRPPRPEPIRAVIEVRFVDRFQQHDDRPLEDFVFQRGNADGAGLSAGALRDMHPSHRRCPVRARLRAFQERSEVALQVSSRSPRPSGRLFPPRRPCASADRLRATMPNRGAGSGRSIPSPASVSPTVLSVVVAYTRFRSPMSPSCFPPTV